MVVSTAPVTSLPSNGVFLPFDQKFILIDLIGLFRVKDHNVCRLSFF